MVDLDYKTIVRLLPDIIYRIDPEGLFTYVNDSVSLLGYAPSELIGRHFSFILHPDEHPRVQRSHVLQHFRHRTTSPEETPKLIDERRTESRATRDLEVRLIGKNWNPGKIDTDILYGNLISSGVYSGMNESTGKRFTGTIGLIRDVSGLKKTEDLVVRAEKHYRSLIENSTDIITIVATDGTILFEGPSVRRVLGYLPTDRIGENIDSFIHEDDRMTFKQTLYAENDRSDEIFNMQYRARHALGQWKTIETTGKAVHDDQGTRMCVILNSRDITELKNKEMECRASLEQSKAIIDSSMDAILVIDQEGGILEANPEAEAMYRRPALDMVRMNYRDIAAPSNEDYFATIRESVALRGFFEAESRNIRRTGELFDVEIRSRHLVYRGENKYLVVIRDITPQKKAAEALQQSEEKYRAIVENSSDVIWITDLDGTYRYISPAIERQRGYRPDEILSQHSSLAMGQESAHSVTQGIAAALEQERNGQIDRYGSITLDVMMNHKNGSPLWVELSASFLRNTRGEPVGILGVSRDVTQRKKAQQELTEARRRAEESEKLKSAFLANMSHEIRTPMNSVIGYADLMCSSRLSGEQKEFMENIKNSGVYLLKIIDDILDLSKIESGQLDIEAIPCDIRQIFDGCRSQARMLIAQSMKQIDLRESISPAVTGLCLADPTRLQQVMSNLLSNAIKFTSEGFIEYGVGLSDGHYEFYVRDTGIGIMPEDQERIFEDFQQAESGTMRKYGGTGLGLAISKRLVELMGGRIFLQSRVGEGHGSTFYFTVPYRPAEATHDIIPKIPEQETAEDKNYNILVVEDNATNLKLAKTVLEKYGYTVDTASDGREALSKFKANPGIDLIFMDIQMPVLDGLEAARLIRALEEGLDRMFRVPIIALTAHAMKETREACMECGFTDFLTKPINQTVLKDLLKKYLK
jgi:PAS domain S-box-containing protein